MTKPINIAIAGVGGQGIILASDIVANAALCAGHDVKKNEVHGMAQRGGAVVSEIRFGKKVQSPIIPDGQVDVLVALELLEALRHAHRLRRGGLLIANELQLLPAVRPPGAPAYPVDVRARVKAAAKEVILIPAAEIARQVGNARAANTVLIGALSRNVEIPLEAWKAALQSCLRPSLLEVNQKAFASGRRRGRVRRKSA
ncbi:MAG: indolepyruvate oxidoreductase subunit beta [Armatimonadetes bacterium]|nr:indolepyruvate oxidoreductase subunit beta [Armatimonadota bacterium]